MDVDADDAIVPDVTTPSTELYERKRKQLFDSLCTAEKKLEGSILEQKTTGPDSEDERPRHKRGANSRSSDVGSRDISDRRFHGQESIFKKPPPGIMKCLKPRRTPGYQVNPHKWKKYSLSDTDTSDRTNTAAAFEFLREIEERKRTEAHGECMDMAENAGGEDQKIVFKRRPDLATKFNQSVHLRTQLDVGEGDQSVDKPVLRGSKVVMPEYVIGQKLAKEKRVKAAKSSVKVGPGQLKLGHLFDEEEDQ